MMLCLIEGNVCRIMQRLIVIFVWMIDVEIEFWQ